jgi:hypothetical protein
MGDAGGVDDPDEVQRHASRFQTVKQSDAAAQHNGDQADDQLVHQTNAEALLDDAAPCRNTSLPSASVLACWTACWMPSVTNVYGGSPAGTVSGT